MISGLPGAGKTTAAIKLAKQLTPENVYMIETESGHNAIRAVDEHPDTGIIILRHDQLNTPSNNWFGGQFGLWDQLEEGVEALYELPRGTVIIDSASDLLGMAVAKLSIQWGRGDKAFPSMLYGVTYGFLKDTLSQIRAYHNLICTVRLKPEYKNDEETGNFKREIWSQGNYLPETIVNVSQITPKHRFYYFEKGKRQGYTLYNGLDLEADEERYANDSDIYKTARAIDRAIKKSKGRLSFDWEKPLTMERMKEFITSVKSKQNPNQEDN